MICEKCEKEHDGSYGSGRFCSSKCARSFSTSKCRDEINKKVSVSLMGRSLSETHPNKLKGKYIFTDEQRARGARNGAKARAKKYKLIRDKLYNESWDKFTIRFKGFIKEYLFNERGKCCEICKISDWLGKRIVIELHHIDGNNKNNSKDNLQLLCPNCHSQTDNWKGKNLKQAGMAKLVETQGT